MEDGGIFNTMDFAGHNQSLIVGSTWSSAEALKAKLIKECAQTSANS